MPDRPVQFEDLSDFTRQVFCKLGCSADDAATAADVLTWASLRGVDTHGIRNLVPYYVNSIRSGQIDPCAKTKVEFETNTSARMNGGSGLGLVNSVAGMRVAIAKAKQDGVGMVSIHNTHHLGPAGYCARLAITEEMLGFCATGHFFGRGNDVGVAPINGAAAMFSTNPFSFAAPCKHKPPFLLDMSTAVATVNRVEMLGQRGESVPEGWAKNAANQPTTDPLTAKILYPLGGELGTGGHKGIGLSMMVSILSGVLSSGWSESLVEHDHYDQPTMGHFMAAIRIDQFMPVDQFTTAMDAFVEAIQCSDRHLPQEPIHYPGSQEYETAEQRRHEGIPIDERLFGELCDLAAALDIDLRKLV